MSLAHDIRPRSLSRLPLKDRWAIAEQYKAGRLVKLIAHEFGLTHQDVSLVAMRFGCKPRLRPQRPSRIHELDEARIAGMFARGMDSVSLAGFLGCKESAVANALSRIRDAGR